MRNPRRRVAGFVLWACLAAIWGQGIAAGQVLTPAEESNYSAYTQHEAVARFLSRVDFLAREARVKVIGRTREVKDFSSTDLHVCILTEQGIADPRQRAADRPTVLITASQHGNEQSAKEAALALIRDLALGELRPLLRTANVLVVPQANPFGNFFDRRQNEMDLDMNRDHVKLESEGAAAIHRLFRDWLPEVTIDLHEKGDDYYRVSIGCVSNVNIHPSFQVFSRAVILSEVEKALSRKKVPFHEFLVTEEMGINTATGAAIPAEELRNREMMKRYSTTDLNDGRNSLGIYETLSFIQECSSRHDLATLRERTGWQRLGLRSFLESVVSHAEEVTTMVRLHRASLLDRARARAAGDPVHLRMEFVRDSAEPKLVIKRFARADSEILGLLKMDKKAGDVVSEDDLDSYPWQARDQVVTEVVSNWYPKVEPRLSVLRPRGYILPASARSVVESLLRHGIAVETFDKDIALSVDSYVANEVIPAKYDYLPPERIDVTLKPQDTLIRKGDFFVACEQAAANLIPCLLEPQSDYGFIRYQAFRLLPAQGDVYAVFRYSGTETLPLVPYRDFLR